MAPPARRMRCENALPMTCMWGPPAKSRVGCWNVHALAAVPTERAGI
jgi:hypothetical protein